MDAGLARAIEVSQDWKLSDGSLTYLGQPYSQLSFNNAAMVELHALGTAEIRTGVTTLRPSQDIVFAAALFLVVNRGKPIARDRFAEILWPDADLSPRRHRLRQTLLQLKRLGFAVRATRDTVVFDAEVATDTDLIKQMLAEGTAPESVAWLPGYNPAFSPAFNEWLDAARDEYQSAAVIALLRRMSIARNQGDWRALERIATKILSIDSFNEEAVLAKAESAAMRGAKRKALSIIDEYLSEIGDSSRDLRLPPTVLRRRITERVPDRPLLRNAEPVFVGRDEEMAVLTRALDEARAGAGSAILVIGEPGIGKSRLSAEVARFAELRGARVQRAMCRRADVERPLSLFVDIVPQLRELPGALGCTPDTFALLKRLTEFEQRTEDSPRALDTERLFEGVRAALFDLLESIAEEHCLLIVIDDVQWLDKLSAALLVRMGDWCRSRRILFVLNARPGNSSLIDYAHGIQLKRIMLGPLGASAAAGLLEALARGHGGESEPTFVEWGLAVAEGNPFFLQQLAEQWIETGQHSEAPPSISKILDERLSRLSPDAVHVLQTAAFLGDFASMDRVERVLGYRPHQFLSAVEELSNAAMLQGVSDGNSTSAGRIRPKHDFLASAATNRLPGIASAFLHRRCAIALETDLAQQTVSASLLWTCATHREAAGDREKALSLRISCAEHLLEMGLAHDACTTYRQTLSHCDTDLDRLRVLSRLARSLEFDGQWNQSIEVLRECVELERKTSSAESNHNDYELLVAEGQHRSTLDYESLLDQVLECVRSDKASPSHKVGAAVLAMKIAVDFGRMDLVDAIYDDVAQYFSDSRVHEFDCLQIKTIYETMRTDQPVTVPDLNRLAESARLVNGELGYSRALIMATTACRLSGRYEEGLRFANRALEHANANRFHSKRREILVWTIALHVSARRFDQAKKALEVIWADPFPSDSVRERHEVLLLEARVAIEEEDFSRAVGALSQAEPISSSHSLMRRCYYFALHVRIQINAGANADTLRPLVAELERAHLQLRTQTTQDFESCSLFLGLTALGEKERGKMLFREWIKQRRVKWPLPHQVLELLDDDSLGSNGDLRRGHSYETAALSTVPLSGVV